MIDFIATEAQRETLFTRGFVAFQVPLPELHALTAQREALIEDLLADRFPGALCIELMPGLGNDDANALMRTWIAEHGLEVRNDRPGEPARDFYELFGPYSALKAVKDAALEAGLPLGQAWFYHDAGLPGAPPHLGADDPLATYMVGVFEQFYGALDAPERAALLAQPACRVQLYGAGCFIQLHQDGIEVGMRRDGVEITKKCVLMCYLNSDWHEAAGGQLECVLGVDGDTDLSDLNQPGAPPAWWADNERVMVAPQLGTFALLDFSRFNIPHIVHPVADDRFLRKMFGWSFATARSSPTGPSRRAATTGRSSASPSRWSPS